MNSAPSPHVRPPHPALKLLETLEQSGHAAYFVGGCVRDSLLGLAPEDWDMATSALPHQVAACLKEYPVLETGLRHGTLTVMAEGKPYQVTTFRADGPYTDRRRPDQVAFVGDLTRDLARRDFTVNAMAWRPREGITDPFGGREDLAAGRIACVGDPAARFGEDALRILRGARFASTLGFAIHPATRSAMAQAAPLLRHVAPERLQAELNKLLLGGAVSRALEENREVFLQLLPETAGLDWPLLAGTAGRCPPDLSGRLAGLLHLCPEKAEGALNRLRYDNRTKSRTLALLRAWDIPLEPTHRDIRWALNRLGVEDLRLLLAVKGAADPAFAPAPLEQALEETLAQGQCWRLEDLAVGGKELLALGVPEGRAVGEALERLLGLVLDGALPNRREDLLAAARLWLPRPF